MAWNHALFMAFKHRSAFNLTQLALRFDLSEQVDSFIELLQTSTALETLTLRWMPLQDEPLDDIARLTQALIYDPPRQGALPSLQMLNIDATCHSLVMLHSRCGKSPLREITLHAEEPFDRDILFAAQIKALRTTGVRVALEAMEFYGAHQLRYGPSLNSDSELESEAEEEEIQEDVDMAEDDETRMDVEG
ncbi:hypothetical protein C8R44DRAFT_165363 [Mycena epipterygia]|nr:hypothetical protein C8R44DRAFT_165363 [Mycena epipterygia]